MAVSYSRIVAGAGGLNGVYHSNNASLSAAWQVNRVWNLGMSGGYSNNQAVTPSFFVAGLGGHSLAANISVQRLISSRLNVQFGYSWIHQSYGNIPAVAADPNSSRVFITLNYLFSRGLGE